MSGKAYELDIHPDQAAGARGEQRFFYLDPAMEPDTYDRTADVDLIPFVIVSAADVPFSGPETYIFPADPWGRIASFGELPGSFRGGWDHERALASAGYVVASGVPREVQAAVDVLRNRGIVIDAGPERKEIEA